MLNLKDILTITGKPGLYKVVSQTTKGVIVEALDEKKTRMPVQSNYHVAMIEEITIFTTTEEDLHLKTVLESIDAKDGQNLPLSPKDDPAAIRAYFMIVAPNNDPDRFYISDMKKILKWYEILSQYCRASDTNIEKPVEENTEA